VRRVRAVGLREVNRLFVVAYLAQYEFQFGIGTLGALFILSGVLAVLGFVGPARYSARTSRTIGTFVALLGAALCLSALADYQPGCQWCRHDGWGGTSPSPFFLVWLVGLISIGVFNTVRAIRTGRNPPVHELADTAVVTASQAAQASAGRGDHDAIRLLARDAPERVIGGGTFPSRAGPMNATWPLLELAIHAWGLTISLHGVWRFMAFPFVTREQFDTRVVWSAGWNSLESVDHTNTTLLFRVAGKAVARFVVLDPRKLEGTFNALEAHEIATRQVRRVSFGKSR